jgi:hypothetical protein
MSKKRSDKPNFFEYYSQFMGVTISASLITSTGVAMLYTEIVMRSWRSP